MNEPLMSTPAAFKSPIATEKALSQTQNPQRVGGTETIGDAKPSERISSSPMMMPPPSVTTAPVSEAKMSPDFQSPTVDNNDPTTTMYASPESNSIPTLEKADKSENMGDKNQMQLQEKKKQQDTKGIESNAEAAASALLMIRH